MGQFGRESGREPGRVVMTVTTNLLHDNRVRKEAETLAAAGYRVTVFSHTPRDVVPRLGWNVPGRPAAIPVIGAAWQSLAGPGRAWGHTVDLFRWGGSQALAQAAADVPADVYHAHDLDTLPTAAWLARRHGARLVYDTHELFVDSLDLGPEAGPLSPASRLKQGLARRNYARLERSLIGHAAGVISVSAAAAGELVRRYHIPEPTVLMNCPRYRDLSGGSSYLRQRLGLADSQRILLLQGAVLPARGQLQLVQSLALLPPEYVLVFLGFNLGTYQEAIRQEISRLGLESRVFLLDALPAEQLLEATASADVGFLLLAGHNLNDRLTLANKLFEYMMAGLPFVATDWPAVGGIVRQTGAGWPVNRVTPDAIAEAAQALLRDPDAYAAMRAAGLAAARGEYNWERQSQHLLDLYGRLLG